MPEDVAREVDEALKAFHHEYFPFVMTLQVTGPDEIDVTKDMTFKLKGTGIHPKSTPGASNGMYVVLTPTSSCPSRKPSPRPLGPA